MESRPFGEGFGETLPVSIGNTPENLPESLKSNGLLTEQRSFDINNKFAASSQETIEKRGSDIRDLIFESVKKSIITSENGPGIAGKIIAELDIKDPNLKRVVKVEVAIMEKIKRDEEIARLNFGRRDPNGRNRIHHLLLRNAKYLGLMGDFVEEIKDNSKESEILWHHHREFHKGHYNAENPDGEAAGIMAMTSVADAIKSELDNIELIPSSPDQDVDNSIDGFMEITKKDGSKEKLPYQVKSLNLSVLGREDMQDRWSGGKERSERFHFIIDNMVTVIYRSLAERIGKGGFSKNIYDYKTDFIKDKEREMNKITDKIFLNNNADKAILIYVPSGKIEDYGKVVPAMNTNGTMHEKIKKMFVSQFKEKVLGEKPEIKPEANIDKKKRSDIINKRAGRRAR